AAELDVEVDAGVAAVGDGAGDRDHGAIQGRAEPRQVDEAGVVSGGGDDGLAAAHRGDDVAHLGEVVVEIVPAGGGIGRRGTQFSHMDERVLELEEAGD